MFLSCSSLFYSAAAFLTLQLIDISCLSNKYCCELMNKHSYHLHINRGPLAEKNPLALRQYLNYLLCSIVINCILVSQNSIVCVSYEVWNQCTNITVVINTASKYSCQ